MFRALLCSSSGAHDYSADCHMGRPVLGLLLVGSLVQAGWISVRTLHTGNLYRLTTVHNALILGQSGKEI